MTAANPEGYRRVIAETRRRMKALAIRETLLEAADLEAAAVAAETITNAVNAALNDMHLTVSTSLVARALIANGLLQVAADWMTHFEGTPNREDNRAGLQTIVDELPPCLTGTSEIAKEVVQ